MGHIALLRYEGRNTATSIVCDSIFKLGIFYLHPHGQNNMQHTPKKMSPRIKPLQEISRRGKSTMGIKERTIPSLLFKKLS